MGAANDAFKKAEDHFRKSAAQIDKMPKRVRAAFWAEAVDLVNKFLAEHGQQKEEGLTCR